MIDAQELQLYAQLAAAAYNPIDLPDGWRILKSYNAVKTDTQALLVTYGTRKILAIRGTESWRDLMTDADFILEPFLCGKAHRGFAAAYYDLVSEIGTIPLDVELDGHSLGAALAAMLSAVYGLPAVTFGQPKIGDEELVSKLGKLVRVVNEADIVPLLPALPGYHHGGTHVHLTARHELIINPSNWQEAKARAGGLLDDLDGTPDAVGDHFITAYVKNLSQIRKS